MMSIQINEKKNVQGKNEIEKFNCLLIFPVSLFNFIFFYSLCEIRKSWIYYPWTMEELKRRMEKQDTNGKVYFQMVRKISIWRWRANVAHEC